MITSNKLGLTAGVTYDRVVEKGEYMGMDVDTDIFKIHFYIYTTVISIPNVVLYGSLCF